MTGFLLQPRTKINLFSLNFLLVVYLITAMRKPGGFKNKWGTGNSGEGYGKNRGEETEAHFYQNHIIHIYEIFKQSKRFEKATNAGSEQVTGKMLQEKWLKAPGLDVLLKQSHPTPTTRSD